MRQQHEAAVQKAEELRAHADEAQWKFAEWVVQNRNRIDEEQIRMRTTQGQVYQKRANLWLTHLRQLSPQEYTEGLQTGEVQRSYDNIWYRWNM